MRPVLLAVCIALLQPMIDDAVAQTGNGHATPDGGGTIVGRVFDRDTGEPLVGGQVVVEETPLGSVTKGDGSYRIASVPVGVRRVSSAYLGYRGMSFDLAVVDGEPLVVDFALPSDVIPAPGILVEYDREPLKRRPVKEFPRLRKEISVPDRIPIECHAKTRLHGAYISDGRWEDQATVDSLVCTTPGRRAKRPRGIISRQDMLLFTAEQLAALAERGYLIKGYNDADFAPR